jgi:hypothetical protein
MTKIIATKQIPNIYKRVSSMDMDWLFNMYPKTYEWLRFVRYLLSKISEALRIVTHKIVANIR